MGFTSLAAQTLLIREFLVTFYGNELTIGFVISNWVILVALGSVATSRFAGKAKRPELWYAISQVAISMYLPASIFIVRNIHNLLGLAPGERVGVFAAAATSFATLTPLGLLLGALFPFACRILSDILDRPVESAGKAYVVDSLGFIIAGPAITLLLISGPNSFVIAAILCILNLSSAALLLSDKLKNRPSLCVFTAASLLLILAAFSFFGPLAKADRSSLNDLWKGQKVVSSKNSIYGNLTVSESGDQYTFYSDGIPAIVTPMPDMEFAENIVDFPMLSHPGPSDVLLIGGGPGGPIREILKYPLKGLTYVELDPLLIKMVKNFPTKLTKEELGDRRLKISYGDGRRFVRLARSSYDVIIVNLPMPSTLQLNRFYTEEFFKNIASMLKPGGILCFSLPSSLAYISPEMRNVNGSVLKSLRDVFHVKVIPGDYNIYIASKTDIDLSADLLAKRLAERGIKTRMMSGPYIAYRLGPAFLSWFESSMGDMRTIRKNFDLTPAATFYSIAYWNSLFSSQVRGFFNALDRLDFNILALALACVGIVMIAAQFFRRSRPYGVVLAIGSSGFAGMSLSLILIYAYQSFYGFVFQHFALLSASFMAGLTLGGWMMTGRLEKMKDAFRSFAFLEAGFLVFCGLSGMLLPAINATHVNLAAAFFALLIVSGYFVGAEFSLGTKLYSGGAGSPAAGGILYAIDLAGSWFAALAVSVALVPIIGIVKTCILLALLKSISLAVFLLSER